MVSTEKLKNKKILGCKIMPTHDYKINFSNKYFSKQKCHKICKAVVLSKITFKHNLTSINSYCSK